MNRPWIKFLVGATPFVAPAKAARREASYPGVVEIYPLSFLWPLAADSKEALSLYLFVELSRCTHIEDRVRSQAMRRLPVLRFKPSTVVPGSLRCLNDARSRVHSARGASPHAHSLLRETTITSHVAHRCRRAPRSCYRGVQITRNLPTRSCGEPQFSEPTQPNTESYALTSTTAVSRCRMNQHRIVEIQADVRGARRGAPGDRHLHRSGAHAWSRRTPRRAVRRRDVEREHRAYAIIPTIMERCRIGSPQRGQSPSASPTSERQLVHACSP